MGGAQEKNIEAGLMAFTAGLAACRLKSPSRDDSGDSIDGAAPSEDTVVMVFVQKKKVAMMCYLQHSDED